MQGQKKFPCDFLRRRHAISNEDSLMKPIYTLTFILFWAISSDALAENPVSAMNALVEGHLASSRSSLSIYAF